MKTNTKIWIVVFIVSLVGGSVTSMYLFSAISLLPSGIEINMTTPAWVCVAFNVVNLVSGNILYFKFLRTRKLNTMLFFATVPLTLVFGALTFILASINNFNNQPFTLVKTVLNISTKNYNNYYWLGVVTLVYLIITFVTLSVLTKPVKKIESVTKRLAYGEVRDKIDIGGNKQFLEIENSLNKINENYKRKDEVIKQTNLEYQKFVPKQLVKFLGKKSVLELEIGSQVKKTATILFCNIRNSSLVTKTLSLEENFNYVNSYLNVVSPIIRKNGGFIDKYLDDGLLSVFISPQSAITCAINLVKAVSQKNIETKDMPSLEIGIGIHTGEVIFGVVGDDVRKAPTLISNSMQVASKLEEINTVFGSIMLLTKQTLNELPTSFKFSYRFIGNINLESDGEMSVFECLDVYQRQKREKLEKYHIEFENGVRAYINGKFEDAKAVFEKVYRAEKDDKVCYTYYNKSSENAGRLPLNLHE